MAGAASQAAQALRATSCKVMGKCADLPKLTPDAARELMSGLSGSWTLSPAADGLERSFVARNWKAAMAFLNSASEIAEEEGHHPDVHLTGYRNVKVECSTHAIGGLSENDFILAAKLDAIQVDYSPKWLREHGGESAASAE